jgi:MFS family permease
MMVEMASTNTILQTIVDDQMRGRVMAFYTMSFLGTAPLGSLLAGFVADHIGPMKTILVGGSSCIIGGAYSRYGCRSCALAFVRSTSSAAF